MAGKPGRSGRIPTPTVILERQGKKKRSNRRDEPKAWGSPSMDPPLSLNERQRELYHLAIKTAPPGLFGACDAAIIAVWAIATDMAERSGNMPMWVKTQRRAAAELGFDPTKAK